MDGAGANHSLFRGKTKRIALLFWFFLILHLGCRQKETGWGTYKSDASSTSYSPYTDINTQNLSRLRLAWTFNPDDATEGARFGASESNPIVIDGIMYTSSARHRIYAIDAGTGKHIWSFDPFNGGRGTRVCRGVTYWDDGAEKRGMVVLATGSPSYDVYGADRAGQNLFGNSVVALDARTGKYLWHFQTIHHDLWDYDLPAPPNLVTILRDGKKIDAIAQTSKVGFLYVLNRETGEPLFPVEER